jgi:Integrase core domain
MGRQRPRHLTPLAPIIRPDVPETPRSSIHFNVFTNIMGTKTRPRITIKTHSRPHVSDDNPYSESQFKTLKYRPEFPERFGSIADARAFCQSFFPWYNHEHHHSGIALLTPDMLHYGRAENVIEQRQNVLDQGYTRNPERFVRSPPSIRPAHRGLDQSAMPDNGDTGSSTLNSHATCLKLDDTLRISTWGLWGC